MPLTFSKRNINLVYTKDALFNLITLLCWYRIRMYQFLLKDQRLCPKQSLKIIHRSNNSVVSWQIWKSLAEAPLLQKMTWYYEKERPFYLLHFYALHKCKNLPKTKITFLYLSILSTLHLSLFRYIRLWIFTDQQKSFYI